MVDSEKQRLPAQNAGGRYKGDSHDGFSAPRSSGRRRHVSIQLDHYPLLLSSIL
jgi:hypothetical protein